jgi:hypothetical protein
MTGTRTDGRTIRSECVAFASPAVGLDVQDERVSSQDPVLNVLSIVASLERDCCSLSELLTMHAYAS